MPYHVLVVDDEAPIREMLNVALERQGYRVTEASSSAEARQVALSDPPHLIISDLQLEDSDGLEMVAELKTLLPAVPVLLLTGILFDAQAVQATLGTQVSAYLHKTAPLSKIVSEVHRLLAAAPQ